MSCFHTGFDRRTFLGLSAALGVQPTSLSGRSSETLRPEDFGARGDGETNDTAAFGRLSDAVNRRGGGLIAFGRNRTYVVGHQERGRQFGWTPAPVLELTRLSAALDIVGNGARLICQPRARFGTFDRTSDVRVDRPMPNANLGELASPYRALIDISHCSSVISITDLELDGNLEQLRIGGMFGDTGWQIPATGLLLQGNLGPERVSNLYTHHHGQDGVMIIGDDKRSARSRLSRVVTHYNGRQGLSLTGGRGYDFEDCDFSKTGRSALSSAPSAGVDLEAEVGTIRDISFSSCKFADNSGPGLLADSGDIAGVRFADCVFVGTTAWSAWPHKPEFKFERCLFAGSMVNAFPSRDPLMATKFHDCRFSDDESLSSTGRLFVGAGPIANLGESENVLFAHCQFDLKNEGVLPWSWRATYQDCVMRQASKVTAQTKGRYLGRSIIDGPVDLYGSMIAGEVILNGKTVPDGPSA